MAWGIYRNAAFVAIADTAAKGATAILALIIARFLGPTLYGQYATALAVCSLLLLVTDIGFERELVRRAGKDPDVLAHTLKLDFAAIALAGATALVALAALDLLDLYSDSIERLIWLMGLALLLGRPRLAFRQVCLIWQRSGTHALVQLVSTAALIALTCAVLIARGSLEVIIVVQALVALLGVAFWISWLPAGFLRAVHIRMQEVWRFIRQGLPFGYAHVIWVAYFNFDTFLLSLLRPEEEVGVYAGVYRIIGINYVLGYALASTFTPVLFRKQHTSEYRALKRQLLGSTALLGAGLGAALFVLSPQLVNWTIGAQYTAGIPIAQVLSLAVLFRVMNYGLGEVVTTQDRQGLRNVLETVLLASNILLNLWWIPRWGGLGAAMATVAAEAILFAAFAAALLQRRRQERILRAQA